MPRRRRCARLLVDLPTRTSSTWKEIVPEFKYDPKMPFFDMLVPTVDTVRSPSCFEQSSEAKPTLLFTGHSGVGKSVLAQRVLSQARRGRQVGALHLLLAQTSAARTQETIESKLEKKKKTLLGPPPGKRMVMFVDDVNMPALETYGASPPVELLRQFLDFRGFYDRHKLFWKEIVDDVRHLRACGPPGGGRNSLTPRFVRHHTCRGDDAAVSGGDEAHLPFIIVDGFLELNGRRHHGLGKPIVEASVDLFFAVPRPQADPRQVALHVQPARRVQGRPGRADDEADG